MRILADLHTHTVASGHAYSTLYENIIAAKKSGLKILGVSDHAPLMPGSTHDFHFANLKVIPDEIEGLRVLKGIELNILDENGRVDFLDEEMKHLDYAIASLHIPCVINMGIEGNTQAIINAMKHEKVKIIGHPDDGRYPMDYEKIVLAAKEHKVLLEVNNSSLSPVAYRVNAYENYKMLLDLCKKHEVSVILGSDAHFITDVGNFNRIEALIEEMEFPESLIVNLNEELLFRYLK